MRLGIFVCQLVLIVKVEAQVPDRCIAHRSFKSPESSDMTVKCGTEYMEMDILLCPVYRSSFNESLMVLNGQVDKSHCYGVPDMAADPPVLKFKCPIFDSIGGACNNNIRIIDGVGRGATSDYSNVQKINVSGIVSSVDPSFGTITYRSRIWYMFSCQYPMQYLVKNAPLGVFGVSLAIKDNNGSFISTLTMGLFNDGQYTQPLVVPQTGLNLKTKIFVMVKATNLTTRFNVLLDRCFATTTPAPELSLEFYDLFEGCDHDPQTKVIMNGDTQQALFEFEAFRFVEHNNLKVSTFYLHCITRLCDVNKCAVYFQKCGDQRRRRDAKDVSSNVTVTSEVIRVSYEDNSGES
ncbi:zona pellucida-like domain-containing protein 1 [Genypterus blacodes]|uniref:zona pellucida-like domain-containing protein 1 n=1 Tax=Genypterus blacodes TaxID=154954 RepID=UPI003F7624E5